MRVDAIGPCLGQRRADSVRSYMMNSGVSPSRLSVVSYGEEKPLRGGTSEMAYSRNRRAEFVITWGDDGEHATELGALDAIVVPTGVSRAFTALDDGPNWIMPIVVGADDETEDIVWLENVAEQLASSLPPALVAVARRSRLRFGHRA